MTVVMIWPGTDAEARDLSHAIDRTCHDGGCRTGAGVCGAHSLLLDERAIYGLLFVRRQLLARMFEEEMCWGDAIPSRQTWAIPERVD